MATFGVVLSHPALAYLWDHQVQQKALLPAAAMLEAALTACISLAGESSSLPDPPGLTLLHACILLLHASPWQVNSAGLPDKRFCWGPYCILTRLCICCISAYAE